MSGEHNPSLSIVLGGGGVLGVCSNLAQIDALKKRDINLLDPRVSLFCSSAGALAAGLFANDMTIEDASNIPPLSPKNRDIHAITRELFGDKIAPPNMHAFTVQVGRNASKLIKLDGGELPIADMAAASSALPGVFEPVRLDGKRYIDAMFTRPMSTTHADRANDAGCLIVTAPTRFAPGGGVRGMIGAQVLRQTRQEIKQWQQRNPLSPVALMTPNLAISALITSPLAMLSQSVGLEVYKLAREQAEAAINDPRTALHRIVGMLALRGAQS